MWTVAAGVVTWVAFSGCSDDSDTVFRSGACTGDVQFIELALPDNFTSPTGQGFIVQCDLDGAMNGASPLPIEVYPEGVRGHAIGWLYIAQCGAPSGLVAVGKPAPPNCASDVTEGPAPES